MDSRYLIIKEKRIIFSDIPKSGSQSIRKLVVDYYGKNENIWNIRHYWTNEISNYPDYKLISLIRNPYDRLVSGYYDKFVKPPFFHRL